MASFIRAFAKGLSQFTGKLGAPLEFLVSLYDEQKQDRLHREVLDNLDRMQQKQKHIEDLILSPLGEYPKIQIQSRVYLKQILRKIEEDQGYRDRIRQEMQAPEATDGGLSLVLEAVIDTHVLIDLGFIDKEALCKDLNKRITDLDRFLFVLRECNFPINSIRTDRPLDEVIADFVGHCVNLADICATAEVLHCIHRKYLKASNLLGFWADIFNKMCQTRRNAGVR